jgi:hypothetical protein
VVRSAVGGDLERLRVRVHGDDHGRGQSAQALHADMPQAADADHHDPGARAE